MEKRLILPAILSIILLILAIWLSFLPVMSGDDYDIVALYPGTGVSDILLTIIIPFICMIVILFLGPFIVILLVKLHKIMKLNKYDYFIIKSEKVLPGSRIILRTIFPGLLAVNIGIYIGLSNSLASLIVADTSSIFGTVEYCSVVVGMPIAIILIFPLWMLQSSGLMCKKRIEKYNRPVSPDIESVGQFYLKMMKGYVGISTIISYTAILITVYQTGGTEVYLLFVDPVLIVLLSLPGSLLVEMRAKKTSSQLNTHYEKGKIDTTPKTIKIE